MEFVDIQRWGAAVGVPVLYSPLSSAAGNTQKTETTSSLSSLILAQSLLPFCSPSLFPSARTAIWVLL